MDTGFILGSFPFLLERDQLANGSHVIQIEFTNSIGQTFTADFKFGFYYGKNFSTYPLD